ncbi:hypothetical protein ACHAXN_003131 [Cyclotella atomus]
MVYFANATLRFDGACQPNPGEGGAGYRIFNNKNGNTILEGRHYIGYDCTNNVAEYFGLIAALKRLRQSPHHIGHLNIDPRLRPLYNRAKELVFKRTGREFDSCDFDHVDRGVNWAADSLANDAIQYEDDWSTDYY